MKIWDTNSAYHLQTLDILVSDGVIIDIARNIKSNDGVELISDKNISLGWVDSYCHFGDPGYEHRETIASGCAAAASGGFTHVFIAPNTHPAIQSKSQIEYINTLSSSEVVQLHPIAAVTQHSAGKELTEIYDMYNAGAIAFGDGNQSIQDAGMMLRLLQYIKPLDVPLYNIPYTLSLAESGMMHESSYNVSLGMKGIPELAETIMLQRDIELLNYTQSRLHIPLVTSATAINFIHNAKKRNLKISAAIGINYTLFTDQDLINFDSNYKVFPPYRSKEDASRLIQSLQDGTIDMICTAHQPCSIEEKNVEFEYALEGTLSLSTAFAVWLLQSNNDIVTWIRSVCENPRKLLLKNTTKIAVGEKLDVTIFDENKEWLFDANSNKSLSKNTPLFGQKLKGQANMVIVGNNIIKN